MKMQQIKLVVCDMAGTTVTDEHEVEACFTQAARKTGLKMTDDEILSVQGWAKRYVFEVFWERQLGNREINWDKNVEHSYTVFKKILEDHYRSQEITPTKGCLELFAFLKEHEIAIALTTGFYRKVADIILDKLGWMKDGTVQVSITSDEVPNGRPEPDMIRKAMKLLQITDRKSVINIGDTPSDIQSGKKAGCLLSCCVTNGTHTQKQLGVFAPDMSFNHLGELKLYLQQCLQKV
jgi:phosphonatase-like hydrolase